MAKRRIWWGWLAVALALGMGLPAGAAILSAKRGFADVGANYNNLQATGAGWYYTWGTGDGNPGTFNANHYPMIWGGTPSQNTINNIIADNPAYVLGFNEPERTDQANMTVAQAISSWTTISNGFAGTNIKLVSPAVSDTGAGQAWITDFMNQAASNNLRVDAVAFHWYGVSNPSNPAGAASSFLSRVQWYGNFGKPVFITEFAIHDWGGNYSDAEIIEANRQFLDIVIPELENRSYVAGYSWYHWFSDALLYEGSPSTPTPMALEYVGALRNGDTENIGGRDLGEHVAYLAGGELTATGSAPTNFSYINALSSTSNISGTVDWRLIGNDWARIQPGATLRKTGTNQISILQDPRGNTPVITNNGTIEVAQGRLHIDVPISGTGSAVVKGGTLSLAGGASMTFMPLMEVRNGGTFDVTGKPFGYTVPAGQHLKTETGASVLGNVVAAQGSLLSGGGSLSGNLTAGTGSTVRVGDDGSGTASRFLIDNFESYAVGNVSATASPPWTAHQATSLADIENYSGNKVLTYGYASDFRGTSRALADETVLGNGEIGTYFFRINSKTNDPDHNVGLGDQASAAATNFGDFEAQVRLSQGAGSTFNVDARNGGSFTTGLATGLALNSWFNIWMVINQGTDTYDLYMNTGTAAATAGNKLNSSPLAFRNGTTSDLNTFLALAGPAPIDNGVRVDDIYFFTGFDLTNPTGGFDPNLLWNPEAITITGDFTQAAEATLELNLFDTALHDSLQVGGMASLAGTLKVALATGAPSPQLGDTFDILDLASVSGEFDAFDLPVLDAGLAWQTSDLVTTGELSVIAALAGDFDADGDVDGRDFLIWQRGNSPNPFSAGDLADWQAGYGMGSLGAVTSVPEPGSVVLFALFSTIVLSRRRGSCGDTCDQPRTIHRARSRTLAPLPCMRRPTRKILPTA